MKKIKLFCFPYAGGSAMVYTRWKKILHDSIELCPVELAGRGKRFKEAYYNTFNDAIIDIYNSIKEQLNGQPYMLFGHSMGSLIAYEIAQKIRESNLQEPFHIFFSGRYPPHITKDEKILHTLPDNEFIEEIFKYGGTPKELMENRELLNVFIPILRADYKILEKFNPIIRNQLLNCSISALNGMGDRHVEYSEALEWKRYSNKGFKLYEFDGGHFFILDKVEEVVKVINETIHKHECKEHKERVFEVLFK